MITEEDRLIKTMVKSKIREKKITGRGLSDILGTSESMVCLLLQGRRKWSQKYIDTLQKYGLVTDKEAKTLSVYAARSAGFKV